MATLERRVGVLPAAYREFLLSMGLEAGTLLCGSLFLYPDLRERRLVARRVLKESGSPFSLSAEHFVFAEHQEYQFLFFRRTDGSDPPVYRYVELEPGPVKVSDSFTGWLHQTITDEGQLERDLQKRSV